MKRLQTTRNMKPNFVSIIATLTLFGLLGMVSISLAEEGKWTKKAGMQDPRWGLSSSVVDGRIYAIGGGWAGLSTVEVYDPATDTWEKKTDMPIPRLNLSTSAVDGKIYAIGGGPAVNVNYQKAIVEEFDTGFRESKSVNPDGKLSATWGEIKATR